MPELIRSFFVALKRKPQMIALAAVTVAFIWYSFNLTVISFTTTRLQGNNMGLTGFAVMLFSTLAIVCCMNAFPYRKKANKAMVALLFAMLAIVMFCDVHYLRCIADKVGSGMVNSDNLPEVGRARTVMTVHAVLVAVSAFLSATLPVYRKWIRKINTSIEVAANENMETIDISGE